MDPSQFLSALLAIVVIDIVLAGDNAIVIALAARSLPEHLRRRAILWGAVGAIGVRTLMTVLVVWLLKIPGLLLAGGAMLVWIAYRLLRPAEAEAHSQNPAVTSFWGAMRTIVVADAVMGLDNVLAVAGAAHGSYLLVVTGLLLSVPIVIWGSTLVLRVVERHPGVVYIGAGVLVLTAVKMITSEPLLKSWSGTNVLLSSLAYLAIPLVLGIAFLKNHRRLESRIHSHLLEFAKQRPMGASSIPTETPRVQLQGEQIMLKVLIPVDGSDNALLAVRNAIGEYQAHHELELHLLNVQPQLSQHIGRFVSRQNRDDWHHERAQAAMASSRAELERSGVPYETHIVVGERAAEICHAAKRLSVHHIVMGTARKNSLTRMLEDSVTSRVLEATPVPVEVVVGSTVSRWERWGIPAGVVSLGGGLLMVALD